MGILRTIFFGVVYLFIYKLTDSSSRHAFVCTICTIMLFKLSIMPALCWMLEASIMPAKFAKAHRAGTPTKKCQTDSLSNACETVTVSDSAQTPRSVSYITANK